VKCLYRPLTGWKLLSFLINLNHCKLPCLCTIAFVTTIAVFFFSSMRSVFKCTKLLLAAKSPEMRSHAGMAKQTRGRRLRFTQESAPSYTFGWASCKDICGTPVQIWEPHGVTLAGYCSPWVTCYVALIRMRGSDEDYVCELTSSFRRCMRAEFIHSSVICHTTGPQPRPKRFLHLMRSRASSFNESILFCPQGHPATAYAFFLVILSLLSAPLSFLQ
jgi:hypothetical protein